MRKTQRRGPATEKALKEEQGRVERIKAYWMARGYLVDVTVELGGYSEEIYQAITVVRSDLVNGLPVRRVTEVVRR